MAQFFEGREINARQKEALIDTIGLYRIEDILNELAEGADTGKAISKESLLTYEEFDNGWKQSLQQ